MKPRLLLLTLLISVAAFSQEAMDTSYVSVDTFVTTIKYKGDLRALTHQLTDPYPQQLFKARAIFKWITENIAYDRKFFNRYGRRGREPKGFKCEDDEDCTAKRRVLQLDTIAVKMQQYIPFRRDGNRCEFEYVVTDASLYYLDILFDRKRIMRFNVNITSTAGK